MYRMGYQMEWLLAKNINIKQTFTKPESLC